MPYVIKNDCAKVINAHGFIVPPHGVSRVLNESELKLFNTYPVAGVHIEPLLLEASGAAVKKEMVTPEVDSAPLQTETVAASRGRQKKGEMS